MSQSKTEPLLLMLEHDAQHNEVTILRIDSSIELLPDTFRQGIR